MIYFNSNIKIERGINMDLKTYVTGLLICFILSFILGLERQFRHHSLGLRTMILVSIGSYMFVSFSFLVSGYQIDISRVAAQVVAGIGFFGAGVIIKDNEKNRIRGLTTAATLWCDAGIGVLCAGGFLKEATIASLVVLFSNIVLRHLNSHINSQLEDMSTNEKISVTITTSDPAKVMTYLTNTINHDNYLTGDNYKVDNHTISFALTVKKNEIKRIDEFISTLVNEYKITKYEYKIIKEIKISEENDEL